MAAQIQIQDTIIELGEEINYNFQVGDLGEISKSKSTYTSSFKIPRLTEFERLFGGLGIPADRSRFPYQINDVYLLDDYVPIMRGVLVFMRTDELYFNVTAISGAFDFFTEIGETKFSDIEISEIVHEKTLEEVYDRIAGLIIHPYGGYYTYGFAQFGGMSHYREGNDGASTVNIDCLCPAVTAKYLWDKIFEAFPRFTFSGDFYTSQDFERLWVVFPAPPTSEYEDYEVKGTASITNLHFVSPPRIYPLTGTYDGPADFISFENNGTGTFRVVVLSSGYLRIKLEKFWVPTVTQPSALDYIEIRIRRNLNEFIDVLGTSTLTDVNSTSDPIDILVAPGDIFEFGSNAIADAQINELTISFERATVGPVLVEKIYGLSLKSFVKEIMWRYGLLAFVEGDNIDFVRMGSIIQSSDVVDWSDRYVRRTEEEYTLDYNQNNWLRHKYETDRDSYFDKNLPVDNKNMSPQKTIIQSEFFAPLEEKRQYRTYPDNIISVDHFPVFDPRAEEVDLTQGGTFDYKTENRMFFARVSSRNIPYRIGSATLGGVMDVPLNPILENRVHIITFDDCSFASNPHYDSFRKILDHTRVHRIELRLTPIDINQLSLRSLYYFEQEQSYYMLNKLQYKRGTVAKGEFVKISEEIPDRWIGVGPVCQEYDGYRTGWVDYQNLFNPTTGATKPNVPSDPDYIIRQYDEAVCPPEAYILAINEDTDLGDPYRLFVDVDITVYVNGIEVMHITDTEQRQVFANVGDEIRVIQRSNAENNPWPPSSQSSLLIERNGMGIPYTSTIQQPILSDQTFTVQGGVTRIVSAGSSIATGMIKYTLTSETGVGEIVGLTYGIVDGANSETVSVKSALDDYVSEFNVVDDASTCVVTAYNASGSAQDITLTYTGGSHSANVGSGFNHSFPAVPKGNYTINVN